MMPSTNPVVAMVHAKLCDSLSEMVLEQCSTAFRSKKHVHFIVDTSAQDSFIFEDKIVELANSYIGKTYIVNFEKIGSSISLAQTIIPLIYLKSNFSLDIAEKCGRQDRDRTVEILRTCMMGSGSLFQVSKKFLECRKCSTSEKEQLGLDYDLSSDKNALKFFQECLGEFKKTFHRNAVFIFKNLKLNSKIMSSSSTLGFLKKVEKLPTAFLIIVPRQLEHCILPVWDKFSYVKINEIAYKKIENIIEKICNSTFKNELKFTKETIQLFCRKMRFLFGEKIPASVFIRSFTDLLSYKELHDLNIIDVKVVEDFFSTSYVKIGALMARKPLDGKTPYFQTEIERLTAECRRLKLDPHYALPYPFRNVLWHLKRGNIQYDKEQDVFICRRYMRYSDFKKLSRSLSELGYEYRVGTRTWIFSPVF